MPAQAAPEQDYFAVQGKPQAIRLAAMVAMPAPAPVAPQRKPAPRPARLVVGATPAATLKTAPESAFDTRGVFGSVAIAFTALPAAKRWQAVLAERGDRYFGQDCKNEDLCQSAAMKNLIQIRRDAAGLPREAMLALVNRRVNEALIYKSDEVAFGQLDNWAGLAETARRGTADCEDFAIAKMWILKSLGFRLDDMQLVVLRDVKRRRHHAVLAAHLGGKALVLDNVTDTVFADKAARYYKPIYSLSQSGSWIHGFRSGQPALAASGSGIAVVHPGAQ
jgi:predicted transglutaminase-like cysteine proteinase